LGPLSIEEAIMSSARRLWLITLLSTVVCWGCSSPSAHAKAESPSMKEADQLFTSGKYDSALQKYDALQKAASDERVYVRALFRAVECETLLARHEQALDRVRAARVPSDVALRTIVELGRIETFRGVMQWYGFSEEAEEGAEGSAKLSKAAAQREMEAAAQQVWKDRAALARLRLGDYGELLVVKDVDFPRYPSLWDFAVLRLAEWLASDKKGRSDAVAFAGEDFSRSFDANAPTLTRLGALYEESAHLSGGGVERAIAGERWRVQRVMLGAQAGGGSKKQEAFTEAATARLAGWARSLSTPLGRGDAAAKAATLMMAKRRVEALKLIDDVLPKTPESDVAVELRQLRHQILQPELSLSTRATKDGKKAIKVTARNLSTVYLRLYRMDPLRDAGGDFFSSTLSSPRYDKVEGWITGRKPVAGWKIATGDKGDHMPVELEVDAPAPGLGFYLAAVSNDDAFQPRKSIVRAAYANVTDLAIARAETGDAVRYYAFDVNEKAPAPSVKWEIQSSTDWRTRNTAETHAGADGVASWAFPRSSYVQVDALAMRGSSVALFSSPSYHGRQEPEPPLALFLATDRPIYRPGQKLEARVTSIERVRDGSFKIDAHRKVHLVLSDPNGKSVAEKDVVTGAMGSASLEMELPRKGLLGGHTLSATVAGMPRVGQSQMIRVEEYKRPEFEVTLEAPKAAAKYGELTKLSGSVKYYFGGAAAEVPVKFKVSRQRWIPWWYYWRSGSSPKVEIARGELKTDKQGGFTVEFTAAPDPDVEPSEDPDLPDVSDFVVEVEAQDAGGRTISADRSLRVGAQALLVSAEAERGFFLSDEKPQLKVKASNLEEQPVAAEVTWELERLGAPKDKPSADLPLQAILKKYPADGAPLQRGSVKLDGKTPAALTLPSLAAGGYRVRLSSGTARGSFAFLVADAKTRALSLSLPAIALARSSESQPGEHADVLVGASAASGAYHLELWRGNALVEHRLERGAPVRVWSIPVGDKLAGGFTARFVGVDGMDAVGADLEVRVPRKDKTLTVKLVGKPEALEPGQGARWSVEVRDQKGRPVEGEALVTVYDRSLELYARSAFSWATQLWAAPPAPARRTDGLTSGWGVSLPEDDAAARRIQKEIQGNYKPSQLPRFSWEQTRYRYGAMRGGALAVGEAVPAAAPAPAEATTTAMPMRRMNKNAESGHEREEADNGIVDKLEAKEAPEKGKAPPPGDLRTNMAETAAWLPDVKLGSDGRGTVQFKAPERLTSWRVQILALGRAVEAGAGDDTFATKKPLMVRVEIPRFFREGDRSTITAVVHNETDQPVSATVELDVRGAEDDKPYLDLLGIKERSRKVEVPAHGLAPVEFAMTAPDTIATYKIRAHAQAGKLSDAEERELPVLPSRERLVQSRVVALKGNDQQTIRFDELLHSPSNDPSLRSEAITVSIDPQLALAVLRSIPYLVEYPYECVEQTLNRYVPLAIVGEIYKKYPALAKAIAAAPHRETQNEPWLKDDPRRMLQLTETPWLVESQGGSRDSRLRDLLNPSLVSSMGTSALDKLRRAQLGDGGFPWFPGGRDDFYMTLYVLEQLALLQEFGIEPPRDVIQRALAYVGRELPQHLKKDEPSVAFLAYGSYVITSFDPKQYPQAGQLRGSVEKWMKYVLENKQILTPFGRAWCARTMARLGDRKTALELLDSALDGAKTDPVVGVYWTPERYSWMWYSDSVEKHAFFLRTLAELKPDDARVPGMLQWLLFNRKGNQWHSTKASAAAVYSILELMQKQGSLTKPEKFHVQWAKEETFVTVRPDEDRRAPLMWTHKGRDITPAMGEVKLGKEGPGIAFGSATWIFSSTKLQDAHPSNLVSIDRKYFVKVHKSDGDHLVPIRSGDKVRVGDEIEVRLYVKTKSQFEYVHVKEPRGAGFEETTLVSGWTWDKLPAYQEPRDSLFNFFVSWLPHGEYELRHSLRPTTPGKYRIGSAVLQSMYSPDITAYSSGMELEVTK
jgi:uncharacterized protein YfaS (alpha-2-macroglobulin family)